MARFCPKCGTGMTDEAAFCGQCGARFEDYVLQELPDGRATTGSMTLGDTGLLKGNLANAPASVGGMHIAVGGNQDASDVAKSPLREHCPLCGKLIREDDDYYRCPKCKKNYVCPDDYDGNHRACKECAGTLTDRVEHAAARARKVEEELARLQEKARRQGEPHESAENEATDLDAPETPEKTLINSIGMEFVLIPAGEFLMGSHDGGDNEQPVHEVTISQPFYLGKYPVTQGEWEAVIEHNSSYFKGDPNLPVESVSWERVQVFIHALNANESGTRYRLPTEAEWEYAARAGSTTAYSFGDDEDDLDEYAWFIENSGDETHPVGRLQPNAWGLYDMHGNVAEWVQDWEGTYRPGAATDPQGAPSGSSRVARGGGWDSSAGYCRSACRSFWPPGVDVGYLGFRLLRTVP